MKEINNLSQEELMNQLTSVKKELADMQQASYQPNGKPHGDPGNAQNRGTLVHGSH